MLQRAEEGAGKKLRVQSVFFGGGTPSLMPPSLVEEILCVLAEHAMFSEGTEVTLEANPTSSEAERFEAFRLAGVNRASVGVQALNTEDLRFLGREHGVDEAKAAVAMAAEIFPRVSLDMIYALPGQTEQQWEEELQQAMAIGTEHLSLYQLTIEKGTPFYSDWRKGDIPMPSGERAAALYELTDALTKDAGFVAYEVSNYAKAGQDSEHNLAYWRYQPYLGIGPGAHGRMPTLTAEGKPCRESTMMLHNPTAWYNQVEETGHGLQQAERLDAKTMAHEYWMMGLRLKEGVCAEGLLQQTGLAMEEVVDLQQVALLQKEGIVVYEDGRLWVTARGRLVLHQVLGRILL